MMWRVVTIAQLDWKSMNKIDLREINGCIFDLDGTLLDSMHVWQDVDRKYLARFGIKFDVKYSNEIKKMTFNESADYFINKFNIPRSKHEIMNDWNEMVEIEYRYNIKLKKGAKVVLKALKENDIKMCIATSCNENHAVMALKRLKIDNYFTFLKTCKQVGKNKEFPDIFIDCAIGMNTPIEKTIVFEDLYMALKVAGNAGFKTCGIIDELSKHETIKILDTCDYCYKSFENIQFIEK